MKKSELINTIIVACLGLGLSYWTYVSNVEADEGSQEALVLEPEFTFDHEVSFSKDAILTVNGRDQLVLLAGAKAIVSFDEDSTELNVNLIDGSLIMANEAGDFTSEIVTTFAKVSPNYSTVFVSMDAENDELQVYGVNHPSLLTYLSDGEELNSMYVPTNYRVKVLGSKVNETISKLRLAKLSKEFQIVEFKSAELPTDVTEALAAIRKQYTNAQVAYLSETKQNGDLGPATSGLAASVSDIYQTFRSYLTFAPFAKEKYEIDQVNSYLEYAISNSVNGNLGDSRIWLDKWIGSAVPSEDISKVQSDLFFVLPGNDLYPIKEEVAELNANQHFNQIESLVLQAANVEASLAFKKAVAEQIFSSSKDLGELSRRYVILELLLRSNSIFYSNESEDLLRSMEVSMLSLAESGQDLDEERQAFIQSKIRFLTNLFSFVKAGKISVSEAGPFAAQLLLNAEDYLNAISSKVAVRDYFKQKLSDFQTSISYINSPEFSLFSDYDEGLTAFVAKQKDIDDLNAYLQNIRGGNEENIAALSSKDALAEVLADFDLYGIQYSDVKSLGDVDNRLYEVEGGRVSGYAFTANYDRETKILYDVTVEDLKFTTGLLIAKFKDVVKNALQSETLNVDDESDSESVSASSSLTEEVALSYALSQFESAGFDGDSLELVVVDLEKNLFSFETYIDDLGVTVSGTFDGGSNKVSELVWDYNGESKTLPDMDLNSLLQALESTLSVLN